MQNLLEDLTKALEKDEHLVIDGQLNKALIEQKALSLDKELLTILKNEESLKKHFFVEVDDVLVFDKVKFQQFIHNKSFLPDSYTAFKNKIGLTDSSGNYLSQQGDVVLAWPHKDCVLQGGQDKEDAKREEIFWNETLAPDDIDRLLAPKAFTGWKKYDKDGELEVEAPTLDDNLLIKGNNLLALHSLAEVYRGKVKLIYIDPPYNTGGDSFGYNDKFNHSSWMSFIKDRIKIAKDLLAENGVIFVSLDDNEAHYCKVLMDEIFKRENFIADICHKSRASISNDKIISPNHNHILLYAKNERQVFKDKQKFGVKKTLDGFDKTDKNGDYKLVPVDGPGGAAKGNPHYSFEGIEGYWRFSKERMQQMYNEGLVVRTENGLQQKYYKHKAEKSKQTITTWWEEGFLTSSATIELKKLMGDKVFKNPKNVNLLSRIVELWSEDGDIILDFFGGSATTAQAVLDLNRLDGLNRKFIIIEQMDYVEDVTRERILKVIGKNTEGGFSFLELKQANQQWVENIQEAKNAKTLSSIWEKMKEKAFISYKVDISSIDKNAEEFAALSLNDQKRFLIEVLDKNQLYVNYSEMEDEDYGVSEEDKKLTKAFYDLKGT